MNLDLSLSLGLVEKCVFNKRNANISVIFGRAWQLLDDLFVMP